MKKIIFLISFVFMFAVPSFAELNDGMRLFEAKDRRELQEIVDAFVKQEKYTINMIDYELVKLGKDKYKYSCAVFYSAQF